jgi:hypothetical protein
VWTQSQGGSVKLNEHVKMQIIQPIKVLLTKSERAWAERETGNEENKPEGMSTGERAKRTS